MNFTFPLPIIVDCDAATGHHLQSGNNSSTALQCTMATNDTHRAIVMTGIRHPLAEIDVPTEHPVEDEVLLRVEWTASTPLDLHQADGGLLVQHPQRMGDGVSGTVLEVGPATKSLKVGDKAFGFLWREAKEKAHQQKVTAPEWLFGKVGSRTRAGQRHNLRELRRYQRVSRWRKPRRCQITSSRHATPSQPTWNYPCLGRSLTTTSHPRPMPRYWFGVVRPLWASTRCRSFGIGATAA